MADEAMRLELRAANLIALNDLEGAREAMDAADDEAAKPEPSSEPAKPASKAKPKGD